MKRFSNAIFNRMQWSCVVCMMICSCGLWAEYQVTDGPELDDNSSAGSSAVSPNGKIAAVGGSSSNTVYIYNTSSGDLYGTYQLPKYVESEEIKVANNGTVVIGGQGDGVYCCDTNGTEKWTAPLITGEVNVAITPDGASVFAEDYVTFYRLNGATGAVEATQTIDTRGWSINDIASNTAGDRVLLRTNSDVIITDADGNELYFYDVYAGNALVSGDLSPDGTQFVVAYTDGTDYHLALYTIGSGLEWSANMGSTSTKCRIDEDGLIYSSTVGDLNRIWSNSGNEIIAWENPSVSTSQYIDASDNGSVVLGLTSNTAYVYYVHDIYTCYSDLYLQAYLVDINPSSMDPTKEDYVFVLSNWQDLPDELFVPAPELSPCGVNTSASRTYAFIFGDDGVQYGGGHCGIYDKEYLMDSLKIGLFIADPKPDHFKVVLWDRKCGQYFESNYVRSDHDCPVGDLNGDCIVNLLDLAIISGDWLVDNN